MPTKITDMKTLVEEKKNELVPFREGTTVEVTVRDTSSSKLIVDIAGVALGIIPDKEFSFDTKELRSGDRVVAYVVSAEGQDKKAVLSLRRADRDRIWSQLEEKYKKEEPMMIKIKEANRGGLMGEANGIEGFLPVSQLKPQNYPRVEGGDADLILAKLKPMIGKTLKVKIINLEKGANKLVFSERAAAGFLEETLAETVKIGDILDGRVTGLAQFGVFITCENGVEGLVHISEISWDRVENISKLFKIGDKVKVKVLQISGNRVAFSIKRLIEDPWIKDVKKFKVGDKVKGEVTRVTPFGAFVKLTERVSGLAHISQLGIQKGEEIPVELGKSYEFEVINLEPELHRLGLRLVDKKVKKEKKIPASVGKTQGNESPQATETKEIKEKVKKETKKISTNKSAKKSSQK